MIRYLLPFLIAACGSDTSETKTIEFTIGGEYSLFYDTYTLTCNDGGTVTMPADVGDFTVSAEENGELILIGGSSGARYEGRYRSDNSFVASRSETENDITVSITFEGVFTPSGWEGDFLSMFFSSGIRCEGSTNFSGEKI